MKGIFKIESAILYGSVVTAYCIIIVTETKGRQKKATRIAVAWKFHNLVVLPPLCVLIESIIIAADEKTKKNKTFFIVGVKRKANNKKTWTKI